MQGRTPRRKLACEQDCTSAVKAGWSPATWHQVPLLGQHAIPSGNFRLPFWAQAELGSSPTRTLQAPHGALQDAGPEYLLEPRV